MQNVSISSLTAKVSLRWNGNDATLVRLVNKKGEKVEVEPGDVIEVDLERAKALLSYSRQWELIESDDVQVKDGRGKDDKEAKEKAPKAAKTKAETKAEKKAREAAEKVEAEAKEKDDKEAKEKADVEAAKAAESAANGTSAATDDSNATA